MLRTTALSTETRHAAVREWVRRRLGSVAHELRVARNAQMLFDLTRRWHGLGAADCRVLLLGALAHDVGRSIDDKKHAALGSRMLLDDTFLPLSDAERRRVAYLTRYHKGKAPQQGADSILDGTDDPPAMHLLLGLLRVADTLDSRWMGGPRLVMTVAGRGAGTRILSIYGYVEGDAATAREVFAKPKKLRLLEETLGCQVRVEWFGESEIGMVG